MRSRFGTALFVVILALVVPAPAMSGDDNTESETSTNESALTVHVTPAFAFAPARVRALVKIREDSRNRRLHVVIDSGGHYQSSDIQLDGADARKIQEVSWKALPSGNYTLVAVVYRASSAKVAAVPRTRLESYCRSCWAACQ